MYRIGDWRQAGNDFREVFNTSIQPFYDGFMTVIVNKKISIDVFKFDDFLHGKYGDYEEQGKCMEDVIREHYGEKGLNVINKLT